MIWGFVLIIPVLYLDDVEQSLGYAGCFPLIMLKVKNVLWGETCKLKTNADEVGFE